MSTTAPPTAEQPGGVSRSPLPARRYSDPSRIVPALILIALGLVFLAGNVLTIGGGALFLGLGAAFLVARILTGAYGLAVPAGILLGFGAYVSLEEARILPADTGGWFFLLLGLGFLAVYIIGLRPAAVWPLFPAAILMAFGAMLMGLVQVEPFAQLVWLGAYWPLILVAIGLWLLVRDRLPRAVRAPLAALGLLLIILYGVVMLAATGAAAAWPVGRMLTGPVWTMPRAAVLPFSEEMTLNGVLAPGATFRVNNPNGRTSIRSTAGDEVRVVATTRYASAEARPEAVLRPENGSLVLDTHLPNTFGWNAVVDYAIEVPAGAPVDTTSVSGDIQIDGVAGPVQATSTSGDMTLTNLAGPVSARSVSGDVRLTDIQGEVRAGSTSGHIDGAGLLRVREADTTSGDITLAGRFADDARITSTSGDVKLRFAPMSAARIDVTTLSGDIRPDSAGLTMMTRDRRHLSATLGTGTATLAIRTSSGDVSLTSAS